MGRVMAGAIAIKRGFADLPHGQMHYRCAGEDVGVPLLLLHASPGSARQLHGLIDSMAGGRWVLSPDTPGNGDSVPLLAPGQEPTIIDLAGAMLGYLDAMGVEMVDVYGSHTGAAIATELAILAPGRVRSVILDGISWLTAQEQVEILDTYAHPFTPDLDGAYLIRLFQFCRDQYLFFPWYRRTREDRRDCGLGTAADLNAWVTEVMKAGETYHLNYRAAFKWDAKVRLPLLGAPALMTAAANDPLVEMTEALGALVADGRFRALPRFDAPDFAVEREAIFNAFLTDPTL